MSDIIWPDGYVPGFTANFSSNEVIVADLTVAEVWPLLNRPALWPTYYGNATDIHFHGGKGPELKLHARFGFSTFGLVVEAQVVEHVAPVLGQAARVAWRAWTGDAENPQLDVHHAWLLEDLAGKRLRVLTQETQKGDLAATLAADATSPLLNAHQQWLNGLIGAARLARMR